MTIKVNNNSFWEFAKNDGKMLTIAPQSFKNLFSDYQITIVLNDTHMQTLYPFKLNVFNSPPQFTGKVMSKFRMRFNT